MGATCACCVLSEAEKLSISLSTREIYEAMRIGFCVSSANLCCRLTFGGSLENVIENPLWGGKASILCKQEKGAFVPHQIFISYQEPSCMKTTSTWIPSFVRLLFDQKYQENSVKKSFNPRSFYCNSIAQITVDGIDKENDKLQITNVDVLFSYSSNLLEKTSDAVIKAGKTGDLGLVSHDAATCWLQIKYFPPSQLKELHLQGYSLLSIDAIGLTALHHASRYGNKDVVRFLIAYAPNSIVNMIDNDKGQTALHKAAAMKRRSVCYMLVAAGSNLLIRDAEGKTPKILALEADDHELAAYLESK